MVGTLRSGIVAGVPSKCYRKGGKTSTSLNKARLSLTLEWQGKTGVGCVGLEGTFRGPEKSENS